MSNYEEMKGLLDEAKNNMFCLATDETCWGELTNSQLERIKQLVESIDSEMYYIKQNIKYRCD